MKTETETDWFFSLFYYLQTSADLLLSGTAVALTIGPAMEVSSAYSKGLEETPKQRNSETPKT